MKKLSNWLQWIRTNPLFISVAAFMIATTLVPKIPLFHVEYTYIKIRIDDFFIIPVMLVYFVHFLRQKKMPPLTYLFPILLFWGAVFLSFLVGAYIQDSIPVDRQGLLHALRRVQYMLIFFPALASIDSEKRFFKFMSLYLGIVFLVCLYGVGQKFALLPSIQSMNPAYVDGRMLFLKPEDRINSTFGGHFDLAAYLIFSMPIMLGFTFYRKKVRDFALFLFSLVILLFTSARSSFGAYVISTALFFFFWTRKLLVFFILIALTVLLLFATGEMGRRIKQTFQVRTVFVNQETGQTVIDQFLSTKKLPAGDVAIKFPNIKIPFLKIPEPTMAPRDEVRIYEVAKGIAREEARLKGKKLTSDQFSKRAHHIADVIKPEQRLLCDISCSTRLQIEWPRAIKAFLYNPFFGSGPFSLGEATDNGFLRWFGEFGILGTSIFITLLYSMTWYIWQAASKIASARRFVYFAYAFSLLALLLNTFYQDTFEASKIAYNFWLVSGLYVGAANLIHDKKIKH